MQPGDRLNLDTPIWLDDGSSVAFRELVAPGPALLVFLRHFGCLFCREQVARLRDLRDRNIVFVGMGSPSEAAQLKASLFSPHRFVCDPDRHLYREFGLPRGGVLQMVNARVVGAGARAMAAGHRQARPSADPLQLSGAFLVGIDGEILWARRSRDASGEVSPEEASAMLEPKGS
ncbi:MAG: AhpC/TSA family protein [Fimbriimonadaceae bacterium]|nr:AhpC/TSA family protein [Fimbriimonadaceae bacterium]